MPELVPQIPAPYPIAARERALERRPNFVTTTQSTTDLDKQGAFALPAGLTVRRLFR